MLTNGNGCGSIIRRSKRGAAKNRAKSESLRQGKRTLKIKQRRNKDPTILKRNLINQGQLLMRQH